MAHVQQNLMKLLLNCVITMYVDVPPSAVAIHSLKNFVMILYNEHFDSDVVDSPNANLMSCCVAVDIARSNG